MVPRGSMGPASKSLGIHIPQDLTWKPRLIQPGQEGSLGPHFLVFTEEKPALFRYPGQLLPLLHLEHPYQLYYSLEQELVWHGPEDVAKGGGNLLPAIGDIHRKHSLQRATAINNDFNHPAHSLTFLLPSGGCYMNLGTRTNRFRNIFLFSMAQLSASPNISHTLTHTLSPVGFIFKSSFYTLRFKLQHKATNHYKKDRNQKQQRYKKGHKIYKGGKKKWKHSSTSRAGNLITVWWRPRCALGHVNTDPLKTDRLRSDHPRGV